MGLGKGRGRPASVPEGAFDEVLQLHARGLRFRRIANALAAQGICFCAK